MKKRKVSLACEICRKFNYVTNKSDNTTDRIVINKFCPQCRLHTTHKEEK